jgi:hypothetical protein
VNIARNGRRRTGARVLQLESAVRSGDKVEFTNYFPEHYPDVSRYLLRIHASLAEVFHMTGGGEQYDEVFRDGDAITQLSGDGTDWNILCNRLAILA